MEAKNIDQQVQTDLASFNNDWYDPGAGTLKRVGWFLVNAFFIINPLNPSSGIRTGLLRMFGAKIGKGVVIKPGVNIKYPWFLEVGDHVWIGENAWIDNLAPVVIEDDVCLSQGAMLLTGNHDYKKPSFDLIVGGIHLEKGVWIGAKSLVGPGVRCYSHSILSISSATSRDLEAYTIYRGNPAQPVKKRIMTEEVGS
ncbi:MAG: WcaF family extracellular polysaccharide biosynthesis acetyltransferase [Bacteroidota bacterium]